MRKLLTKVVAVVLMLSMVFSTCVFAEFDPKAPLGPGINCVKTLADGTTAEFFTLDRKDEIIARLEKEAKRNDARKFSEKQETAWKVATILGAIAGAVLNGLGANRYKKLCPASIAHIGMMLLSPIIGLFMFFYPDYINEKMYARTDSIGNGCRYLIRRINNSIKLIPYYADNEYRKQVEQGLAILRVPKAKNMNDLLGRHIEPDLYTQYTAQSKIDAMNISINLYEEFRRNKSNVTVKE